MLRILAIITGKSLTQLALMTNEQFKNFLMRAKSENPVTFKHLHCELIAPNTMTGLEIIRLVEDKQKKKGIKYTQVVIDYDGNIETDLSSTTKSKLKDNESKSMYYAGGDIYSNFNAFAKRSGSVVWLLSQPKPQFWNNEKLPIESLNDSSKKQHHLDFIMSIGFKDVTEPQCTFFISKE